MKFVRTAIWTESAISANCLSWVRQNFWISQLICYLKNNTASQNKWHDIHFILIQNEAHDCSYSFNICVWNEAHDFSYSFSIHVLNEAHDSSAVRKQLCSLILFVIWYHLQFDIADRFDMICSLISFAVWYHLQFDIVSRFDMICSLISSAVWYYVQFDIVYTHSFYFSYSTSIAHLLASIFLD